MNVNQRNVNAAYSQMPHSPANANQSVTNMPHIPSSYGQSKVVAVEAQDSMPCNCKSYFLVFHAKSHCTKKFDEDCTESLLLPNFQSYLPCTTNDQHAALCIQAIQYSTYTAGKLNAPMSSFITHRHMVPNRVVQVCYATFSSIPALVLEDSICLFGPQQIMTGLQQAGRNVAAGLGW